MMRSMKRSVFMEISILEFVWFSNHNNIDNNTSSSIFLSVRVWTDTLTFNVALFGES